MIMGRRQLTILFFSSICSSSLQASVPSFFYPRSFLKSTSPPLRFSSVQCGVFFSFPSSSQVTAHFSSLMGPDWSLLPPEMLQLISQKITSMDHYVYFRSVCQPWRRACTPHPRHLVPSIPWLNLFLRKIAPSVYASSLYDFSKSRIHNFELPGVNCKDVCGHSCGWIVLVKDKEISFINPITKETRSRCFPSLAAPPTILGFARNEKTTNPQPPSDVIDRPNISKVILTSSPFDMDCIAVAGFVSSDWELGFSSIGDTCWTILKLREYGRGTRKIWDFKCKNDLVYVINNQGCLTVYDLRDLSQKIIIDRFVGALISDRLHLVLGEGELDGVPLLVKFARSSLYEVFMPKGSEWRRVRNIGNAVLLLSDTTCEMVSLANVRLNGWEGNHIYYYKNEYRDKKWSVKIKIIKESIEDGSVKKVPTSLGLFSRDMVGYDCSWFTPSLY